MSFFGSSRKRSIGIIVLIIIFILIGIISGEAGFYIAAVLWGIIGWFTKPEK